MDDEFIEYIPDAVSEASQTPAQITADDGIDVPLEMESMYAWARLFVMLGNWKNATQEISLEYQPMDRLRVQVGGQAWCLRYLPEHGGEATETFFALLAQQGYSLTKLVSTLQQANLPQQWDFVACGTLVCALETDCGV